VREATVVKKLRQLHISYVCGFNNNFVVENPPSLGTCKHTMWKKTTMVLRGWINQVAIKQAKVFSIPMHFTKKDENFNFIKHPGLTNLLKTQRMRGERKNFVIYIHSSRLFFFSRCLAASTVVIRNGFCTFGVPLEAINNPQIFMHGYHICTLARAWSRDGHYWPFS
jgi:hypothetical protein